LLADARTPPARPVAPVGAVAKAARLPEAQPIDSEMTRRPREYLVASDLGGVHQCWESQYMMLWAGEFGLPNHFDSEASSEPLTLRASVQIQAQEMKKLQSNSDFTFLTKNRSRLKRCKMNAR